MNVLTVLCSGGWMPGNLSEGWRRLGCTVHEFLYGSHMGKAWSRDGLAANAVVNARLLATARRLKDDGQLDLIFAVIYDDVLEVATARALRALGIPMVNYHVDLVGQWYRVLRTAPYFDLLACAQRDHWPALRRHGIRPYYLPMAANPLGTPGLDESFDGVLYLGSPWAYRVKTLASLRAAGIPLRVYGHGWRESKPQAVHVHADTDPSKAQPLRKNTHDAANYLLPRLREEGVGSLLESLRTRLRNLSAVEEASLGEEALMGAYTAADFVPLVRGAAINLGFTHFKGTAGSPNETRQVRLRDFEIPMAGGFYLTQDCAQLRELFDVDTQIGTWNDAGELPNRCRYYLRDADGRRRMAAAAQAHCLKHHTWTQRFSALLRELGMNPGPRVP